MSGSACDTPPRRRMHKNVCVVAGLTFSVWVICLLFRSGERLGDVSVVRVMFVESNQIKCIVDVA